MKKRLGKIGFVGAGGGCKGAISVGILKALSEAGITPDYTFAVSVNVLNFAELLTGGIDSIIKTWKSIEKKGDNSLFDKKDVPTRLILSKPSFFDNDGVKKLISNINIRALTESPIPMEFPVINETQDDETENILNHDERFKEHSELLPQYILASVSVPGLLYPVQIGADWYSDGQFISLEPAVKAGCDTIFVLMNDYKEIVKEPQKTKAYIRFINNYNKLLARDMRKHLKEFFREHKDFIVVPTGKHVPFFDKFVSMMISAVQGDPDLIPHRIIPIAPKGPIKGLGSVTFSKVGISAAIDHGYECGREILEKLLK